MPGAGGSGYVVGIVERHREKAMRRVNRDPGADGDDRTAAYAVAWRTPEGAQASGSLSLDGAELVLQGAAPDGELAVERLPLDDIVAVRIGRKQEDRVNGLRGVVFELEHGRTLAVAPVGATGLVFELAELVAGLKSAKAAGLARLIVVLQLKPGSAARARELAEAGPPFDLGRARLSRHQVFITEHEAIFLFEGPNARAIVERLVRNPRVLREAVRWRECIDGRPRIAEEVYEWRRESRAVADQPHHD
jgi:hypothetical protein